MTEDCKKKKKKKGLKLALNVEGEPVTVGENKKPFSEWVKQREKKNA